MITSPEIFLKVKYRLNKVDTQDYENIPVYNVVEAFNKAQLNVVNRFFGKNNNYKTGVESTKKRIDDLQDLINSEPMVLSVKKKSKYFLTETLPQDYFHYIKVNSEGSIKDCENQLINVFIREESNINTLLNNDFFNPNFEWRETIGTILNNQIKVYTNDLFEINKVFLTYLKKPRSIDIKGYINRDGKPSTNIDPELPDDIVELCVDETIRILSGDMHNQFSNQISQQNIQLNE